MPENKDIFLIGFASGLASGVPGTMRGPLLLKDSGTLNSLKKYHINLNWVNMIHPSDQQPQNKIYSIIEACQNLAEQVNKVVSDGQFFGVMGGDHSCAIGTWSGAARSLRDQNAPIGLIWIDAHMDSHTMETTPSGNIHGMPLAALLGYGLDEFTLLAGFKPVLRPEHVCLIGVRSFESAEAELLKKLGVRLFFMEEVARRGLSEVMTEARKIVSEGTVKYGISVDIDSMDPADAPGTGVCEPNGIRAQALIAALSVFAGDPQFMGFEIAEFDPTLDQDGKTQQIIPSLIAAMTTGV